MREGVIDEKLERLVVTGGVQTSTVRLEMKIPVKVSRVKLSRDCVWHDEG